MEDQQQQQTQEQQQQESQSVQGDIGRAPPPLVTEIVQFIDHNGDIVKEQNETTKKSFLSCLSDRTDFLTKGFDYSVIAILGPQSSGKSTLLNILFNTKFAVMEGVTGRRQTTQGVWMGIASIDSPETYLILDVEGTDGRERGEDEKAFERKTSLFSLVLSSVLIINMWAHDIGRYNAANIGLLKTVFELNLQLFQKKKTHKTLIFFVIRDHDNVTPLFELRKTILEDIDKIWNELSKPSEFDNSKANDFFDFDFTALPHKTYSPDAFRIQTDLLKVRFLDPNHEQFIPKKQYRNEDIPSDGLYQYSNNVWETIKSNRDLDLPSQKEMLAIYRCDEFVESSFAQFSNQLKPIKEKITKGRYVEGFGESSKKMLDACLELYNNPASRYHTETVSKKRQTLIDRVNTELKNLYQKQIEKIYQNSIDFYNNLVKDAFDSSPSSSSSKRVDPEQAILTQIIQHYGVWSKTVKQQSLDYFESNAKSSIMPDSDWEYKEELEELDSKITREILTLKESQISKLLKIMKDLTFSQLTPKLLKITEQASEDMWKKIRDVYYDALSTNEKEFLKRLSKDFELPDNECDDLISTFTDNLLDQLKIKMKERAEFLPMRMRKRFEEHFNLDDKKLPRKWTKHDDVAKIFKEARYNAEKLIDLFSYMRIDLNDMEMTYFSRENDSPMENAEALASNNFNKIIIPYDQCLSLSENFRHDTKTDYIQALNEQSRVSHAGGVPAYMIVLLCALGLNEFIAVISNPFLLLLVIILGIVGFVLFKLGLSGPFLDYLSTIMIQVISKVKDVVLHVEHLSNHGNNTNVQSKAEKKKKD
eukprot:gene5721-7116_t